MNLIIENSGKNDIHKGIGNSLGGSKIGNLFEKK